MTLQFIMSDTASADHGIKCAVYGRSGMGKTMLAATCPAPLILAAEPGMLSLQPDNIERVFGRRNDISYRIPGIRIQSVQDLTEAHQWLLHAPDARNFQTVYLDSVTEIGEVVLSNAKALAKDPRQAYGELLEKATMAIKAFRDLPGKHVVFVFKEGAVMNDATKSVSAGPAMPGSKLGQAMPYLFDEVFRLGVAKTPEGVPYRFLQTQADLQYDAKDRSGRLAPVEPPDLGFVFNKILART